MGLFGKMHRKQARSTETASSDVEPPPPASTEPTAPDPVEELARLENMRDRAMLTQDECDTEKRKLLASQSFRRI